MEKKTLGMMISSLRKEKEMTQLQLAEKMNITDKAVSKWERDLSCPDINSISKLAEVLGTTVDELMQAKKQAVPQSMVEKIKKMRTLILKAVALAMGVAVTVLSILGECDVKSYMIMLGIGMACLAITTLEEN